MQLLKTPRWRQKVPGNISAGLETNKVSKTLNMYTPAIITLYPYTSKSAALLREKRTRPTPLKVQCLL
jgi:hypothetical protein